MSDFNANEYLQDMEDADSLDVKATGDSAKSSAQSSSKVAEGANPAETKADANVSADSANSENTANSAESCLLYTSPSPRD